MALAWCGAVLALFVLWGVTNAVVMAALWALYMSYVHVGQDWYGYGWEMQLLETGFLAIFLCPLGSVRPFPRMRPAPLVIGLSRWLIFRVMFGAGMIKIRGDSCWRDLTCLLYHYETQPNPNPLSRVLHFAPRGFATAGALFNHATELVMPWLMLFGRWATRVAGIFLVAFQVSLIVSGHLSFLNWLTIVPALSCFDDALLGRLLPRRWAARAEHAEAAAAARCALERPWQRRARAVAPAALCALVACLSVPVVENLASGHQRMNTSFDVLNLVNTYGAFGSVGRERFEVVLEAPRTPCRCPRPLAQYPVQVRAVRPARPPCVITPYHYRLDWQIWFAAMAPEGPRGRCASSGSCCGTTDRIALPARGNPFPESPPRYVRARLYIYRFAPAGSGRYWSPRSRGRLDSAPLGGRRALAGVPSSTVARRRRGEEGWSVTGEGAAALRRDLRAVQRRGHVRSEAGRGGSVRFAPLQGETAAKLLAGRPGLAAVDSMIWIDTDGVKRSRSAAALAIARHVEADGRRSRRSFGSFPPRFATRSTIVARMRYRVFGRYDACPVPPSSIARVPALKGMRTIRTAPSAGATASPPRHPATRGPPSRSSRSSARPPIRRTSCRER